jgi:hypothetical protein
MKKIVYVEAMIGGPDAQADPDKISTRGIMDLVHKIGKKAATEHDADLVAFIDRVIALGRGVDDYRCLMLDDAVVPLIKLSSIVPLSEQIEKTFLNGEVVAIVRLSDLEALIANQRSDA